MAFNLSSLNLDFKNLKYKSLYGDHQLKIPNDINFDDLDSVSKLHTTERFKDIMQNIQDDVLQVKGLDISRQRVFPANSPEFRFIDECCDLAIDIDNEIVIVHYVACKKYRPKYPQLESLVINPLRYAVAVNEIENEMGSTTEGLLPQDSACDRLISLDFAKAKILDYVESSVDLVAPNLSALVGNAVAAKLICTSGGLERLARCTPIYLLRVPKLYTGRDIPPSVSPLCPGLFCDTKLVNRAHSPVLKDLVSHLLSFRSVQAALVDHFREDSAGKLGSVLRKEIRKKIAFWKDRPLKEHQSTSCRVTFDAAAKSEKRYARDLIKRVSDARAASVRHPPNIENLLARNSQAREDFEADETMRALTVIFQFGPGHEWDNMHPHVWFRWYRRMQCIWE